MPGGRPPKFRTAEERQGARREQIRRGVQAHRLRKRREQYRILIAQQNQSVCDIADVSRRLRIDLYFNVLPSLAHDFERASVGFPWARAWEILRPGNKILDSAVLAGAGRVLGNIYNSDSLIAKSREAYHGTVTELQQRLRIFRPGDALLLGLTMACLSNFEIGDGSKRTKGSKWAVHAAGTISIMPAAGPRAFQSPLALEYLRSLRRAVLPLAMWDPMSSFLSEKDWTTIPYLQQGKTKEDNIWDYILKIPRLEIHAQEVIEVLKNAEPQKVLFSSQNLFNNLTDICREAENWYQDYLATQSQELMWSAPIAPWFAKDLPQAFTSSWHFRDFRAAEAIVGHWAVILHAHLVASPIQKLLRARGYQVAADIFTRADDPEKVARYICMSMEECLNGDELDVRRALTCGSLPFRLASQFFARSPERYVKELKWCHIVGPRVAHKCSLSGRPLGIAAE